MTPSNIPVTIQDVEHYVEEITEANKEYHKKYFSSLASPFYTIKKGQKYYKIMEHKGYESAYCFVDMFGNIYKVESYSRPAKGIRGHISDKKKPLLFGDFYIKH